MIPIRMDVNFFRNLTYSAPLYVDITKTVVKEGQDPIETQHQKTFIGKRQVQNFNSTRYLSNVIPLPIPEAEARLPPFGPMEGHNGLFQISSQ
jgi:DNA-directed RNA polymerase II subunit RPB2